MGIGVEGYGYGCMSKHLGDDLRVHVAGEQQRGARVPEVVKTDLCFTLRREPVGFGVVKKATTRE